MLLNTQCSKDGVPLTFLYTFALIFITAKANPFDDLKVEEEEKILQPEGKSFLIRHKSKFS